MASDEKPAEVSEPAQAGQSSVAPVDEQSSGPDRRTSVLDRRTGVDRRRRDDPVAVDRRSGLDRRRGPGIRRKEERRSAEEGEMTDEQFEFIRAVDEYKRRNKRPFPTLTEILEIVKKLGYKKVT